jgi:uncharacterized protein (UPF0303 family)
MTTPEQDLQRMALQEERLHFSAFDLGSAWELGTRLKAAAEARGVAVAIVVRLAGQTVFQYQMPGAAPANVDWVRRKLNTVELTQRSSYAIGSTPLRDGETTLQRMGLPARDYAQAGGAFPIFVDGVGCVGAVGVSGLPQREDHALVVDVLCAMCGVPPEGLQLD